MLIANPKSTRVRYPDDLRLIMSIACAAESREWLAHWSCLAPAPTPLYDLPAVAQQLRKL